LSGERPRASVRALLAVWLVSCILSAPWAPPAVAAERDGVPVPESIALEQEASAPVVVDGVELFRVRGISAFPAEKRADAIASRITVLAADPTFLPESLRIESQGDVTVVMGGTTMVMGIYDGDADLEGMGRAALAMGVRMRIGEAIDSWRRDRSPEQLRQNGLYALGATVGVLVVLWLVNRLYRWMNRLNEARIKQKIHDVQFAGFQLLRAQQISAGVSGALRLFWILTLLTSVYLYLNSVLVLFPWTRGFANNLMALLLDPLRVIVSGVLDAIPNLAFLAVLFLVARYLLKAIRLYFRSIEDGSLVLRDFDADWALPTYRLVRLLLIAFVLIIAYPYIPGSGSEAFKGISIFVGIVFSLGSTSVIGNMIAGYTMTYRRVFKLGDRVLINGHLGDVEQVRMLVTYLRTPKNEIVAIPNSQILNGEVVNYSALAKTDGLILHTTVGIGYETPWRQVEAMLLEAAARLPNALQEPRPFILQRVLGDFCVTYELNVYTSDAHGMASQYADLHRNILDVFNEYGVQIMTPAYENDPKDPKLVPRDQWYAAPAQPPESAGTA
jgi:small-conductance mechanosensitive channel